MLHYHACVPVWDHVIGTVEDYAPARYHIVRNLDLTARAWRSRGCGQYVEQAAGAARCATPGPAMRAAGLWAAGARAEGAGGP